VTASNSPARVPTYKLRHPSAQVPRKLHPVRVSLLFRRRIPAKPARQKSFYLQGPASLLADPCVVAQPTGAPRQVPSEGARALLRETCSPCAAQMGWKFVISDLACVVCRACGAPLPVHAMDTRSSQGWMPMFMARNTPCGPPCLPPMPRCQHPQKHRGHFGGTRLHLWRPASPPPRDNRAQHHWIGYGCALRGSKAPWGARTSAFQGSRRPAGKGSSPGHRPARGASRLRGAPPTRTQ